MLGRLVGVAALSLVAFAAGAPAQNLAENGEFDDNVDGWEEVPDPFFEIDWNDIDRNSNPSSGSLIAMNTDTNAANLALVSCVNSISEGSSYQYSGYAFVPTAQTGFGGVDFTLYWWDGLGCSGSQLLAGSSPSASAGEGWVYLSVDPAIAPPGTESAWLTVAVSKGTGGTLAAHADSMDFRATLFRDGFEGDETGYWSFAVGKPP